MEKKERKLTVSTEVPISRVAYTLVGAFEGGSNYWMDDVYWDTTFRLCHAESPFKDEKIGSVYADVLAWAWKQHLYFVIRVNADEEAGSKEGSITPRTIQRGVQTMARDYPRHYDDMVSANDDATTSDVLLQCIIYNDVVFG